MKFIVLAIGLIGMVGLFGWLRNNRQHLTKIWVLVGFLPIGITAIPHLYIAVISWAMWPGYVKGVELSLLDLLMMVLYFTLPKTRTALPFKPLMLLYLFAVFISAFQADTPVVSLFYAWQLLRMFFVYMVVAKACEDERVVEAILTGMVIGFGYEACMVLWQRFALGEVQSAGTFPHPNSLGLVSHFIAFPLTALYLAGKKGWQPLLAPIAGIAIAVLTVSRATIGLAGGGYLVLFFLSAFRKWTTRLAMVALIAVVGVSAIVPFAISAYQRREIVRGDVGDYDERAAFQKAAELMLESHPFGVGANNFVVVANAGRYFDAAGVAQTFESRSAHVHNAYLLAAAETGYLGGFAFILMLLQPLFVAWRAGWRYRKDPRGVLLSGLAVGLLLVYLQSLFEWTFFVFYPQYMFALTLGMVAGLAQQLGYWRRVAPAASRNKPIHAGPAPESHGARIYGRLSDGTSL